MDPPRFFTRPRLTLALVVLAPLLLRLALVFVVDDFEDDAWARDLITQRLSNDMAHGAVSLRSLLGVAVWLPAWQLLCAAIERVIDAPYYVPKVVAAIFGGLSPAIVFALAHRLAETAPAKIDPRRAAFIAWALAALAPWHTLYSSFGMTETFYAFWIVAAIYALVRAERDNRWFIVAAFALAPAVWTRFEGWLLVGVFPLLALAQRRARVGTFVIACVVLAVPPLAWLAINRAVTGDAMHFQHVGAHDVRTFLAFRGPAWSARGPVAIARHLGYIAAVNGVVVTLCAIVGFARIRTRDTRVVLAAVGSVFAFLFTLWLARRQVGWRRYYVPFGMPLTAMAGLALASIDARRAKQIAAVIALESVAVVAFQVHFLATWVRPWIALRRDAATFVRAREGSIYCDEPTVRMLSGLPSDRFVNQWALPEVRSGDATRAVAALRNRNVRWVVFVDVDYSALARTFGWMRGGAVENPFVRVLSPPADRTGPRAIEISVYSID